MKTVFVTGASGFIGRHLARELVRQEVRVKCLVRPDSALPDLDSDCLERVTGDLRDPDSYRHAISGCDTVIHLAGLVHTTDVNELYRINGGATADLSDVCRAVPNPPHLVYVSSLAAAGPPPKNKRVRQETDEPAPVSDYGRSKRQGEIELQRRARDLPITVLRPGMVYGPGDQNFAQLFRSVYRFRLHVVIGFRTPPLSLIYVDDLVRLIIDSSERFETAGESVDGEYSPQGYYLLCDDSEHPDYSELGQRIARSFNRAVFVWPLWRWVGVVVGGVSQSVGRARGKSSVLNLDKVREALAHSWASSSEKARRQLGFQPSKTLDEGLAETANWFLENRWI